MELGSSYRLRPVPGQRRRIGPAGLVHRVDHAEIVIDLQRARLDTLAARAGAMVGRRCSGLDDAERNAAAGEIAGQHQAGGSGAGNQHIGVGHIVLPWRNGEASHLPQLVPVPAAFDSNAVARHPLAFSP
jgi:hypothetical protein